MLALLASHPPAVLPPSLRVSALLAADELPPTVIGASETGCHLGSDKNAQFVAQITQACARYPQLSMIINLYDVRPDNSSSSWQCLENLPHCVLRVVRIPGMKPTFWTQALKPSTLVSYDYVWMFDNDMGVGSFDLASALQIMRRAKVSLGQPRVAGKELVRGERPAHATKATARLQSIRARDVVLSGEGFRTLTAQEPLEPSGCQAQEIFRVEVQTPIFEASAWEVVHAQLFEKLPPVSNKTDYYIDFTWCKMTRLLLLNQVGCAILDPVLFDLDFASLDAPGTGNSTERNDLVKAGHVLDGWWPSHFKRFYDAEANRWNRSRCLLMNTTTTSQGGAFF